MKCIIGIGNPSGYHYTRHNAGKLFLDSLSTTWDSIQEGSISQYNTFILFKTNTFMNLSGPPIKSFLRKSKIDLSQIIIAHDDVDEVLGKVKIKQEGSASGHNGLKSLIVSLGTTKFHRLKIGIGRPSSSDVTSYVLTKFTNVELDLLTSESFPAGIKLINSLSVQASKKK